MPDLGAYDQPVRFNWTAAAALSKQLRASASTLDGQAGPRSNHASAARKQWEGVYGQQFDGRVSTCTSDAGRLSAAMVQAANAIDQLAKWASEEQDRRNKAAAWVEAQKHESWIGSAWDDLWGGDQPPSAPSAPPPFPVFDAPPADRGPAAPGSRA